MYTIIDSLSSHLQERSSLVRVVFCFKNPVRASEHLLFPECGKYQLDLATCIQTYSLHPDVHVISKPSKIVFCFRNSTTVCASLESTCGKYQLELVTCMHDNIN